MWESGPGKGISLRRIPVYLALLAALVIGSAKPASAQDILCDSSFENCRDRLLQLIRNETVGIDVAFWFMEDARYTTELIRRHQAGVPVRVLVDTRANVPNPNNALRLAELEAAGIPMRRRTANGILHWKTMLFAGQSTVQFSAANYSSIAFVPEIPYQNYVAEAIYYTQDPSIVNSFRTKFDELWINIVQYADYANITVPLVPHYDTFLKDAELQFGPLESFRNRSVQRYNAETAGIDATMYRITDRAHSDALIAAMGRGVRVRLLTEPEQYRDPSRLWHSWNVDRLYMAGAHIRHRAHAGLIHQKSTILHGQQMTIFGSSNWTSPSTESQEEHNYFTRKPGFYQWFTNQFERKWNNTTGFAESQPFAPLPPGRPVNVSPAHLATNQATTSVTLRWNGGPWAHLYDVYFGTTPEPPLVATDVALGPSQTQTDHKQFIVSALNSGTTYYWRVVGKTMARLTHAGPIHSFTTSGTALPPPASGELGQGDILVYASRAIRHGNWTVLSDATAAGGLRLSNPDQGQPRILTALASPSDYAEITFTPQAGVPYRLWIRGKAHNNHWSSDSVHVQFSGSVSSDGSPAFRIGTTSSTVFSLEPCNGCGVAEWGWEDNGWGNNVLGPLLYFDNSATQTMRVQPREDGLSIDQILLSPERFLTTPPGILKNDATIYPESDSTGTPPPLSSSGEVVLYASAGAIVGSDWTLVSDGSAAGGLALHNPERGAAKVDTALAAPGSYVDLTFQAEANKAYRLWIRARAHNNRWSNDSVHVQFSSSVAADGNPVYRIGTPSSTVFSLEECNACGVSGWGWEDNGWGGYDLLGAEIRFATSGTQTIRIQAREDGVTIDQIVLSPLMYLTTRPGAAKNDNTILPPSSGSAGGD